MSEFVHLHLHTEYSLLNSMIKLEPLFQKLKDLKMDACAITDSGNMSGAAGFFFAACEQGIKPVIGSEVFVAPGSRFDQSLKDKQQQPHHLVLIAHNNTGYKNLMKLSSISHLEGYYYVPRIDKELLKDYNEGLLCLTGCINGEIPRLTGRGSRKELYSAVEEHLAIFGDRLYFELQDNGYKKQKQVNERLVKLSKHFGIPVVATNNCHYLEMDEKRAYETLIAIRQGKRLDRMSLNRLITDGLHLKSAGEMEIIFSNYPEALFNTVRIAEMCDITIDTDAWLFPNFNSPSGADVREYLEELSRQGFNERLPEIRSACGPFGDDHYQAYLERLAYELDVIKKTGFSDYFLIVADFINYARANGIPVGPGRGSTAGSLIAYCLGITDIDPIKHDLLFERFLNPERISIPDLSVGFCRKGRDDVIRYITEKYGKDKVAHITTFRTMQSKAAVRDVGKVLGISHAIVDQIAKLIPFADHAIELAAKEKPQIRELCQTDERVKELLDYARVLEGIVCHTSTHAVGIIIAGKDLTEYTPLCKGRHDEVVTQYNMKMLENIGLVKIDFLGLETLTLIDEVAKLIREEDIDIDISRIPLDDAKTYELMADGDTSGIFFFEGKDMRDLLVRLKPSGFNDIMALVGFHARGPLKSDMIDEFIKRKNNPSLFKYDTPKLEEILHDTYGVIIYQEQIMKIASVLAGFSMKDADALRRAMNKKVPEQLESYKEQFVEGTVANAIPRAVAEKIYDVIQRFGEYGFNKSHSTAYGLIAYQCSYLKANYYRHYMAVLLTRESDDADKVRRLMGECKKHGVPVLPLDINKSEYHYAVEGDHIRCGFCGVKGVSASVADRILDVRNKLGGFLSWEQFQNIVDLKTSIVNHIKKIAQLNINK